MTYLLDTDTCVYWLRGRASVAARLAAVDPADVTISVATLCELRYGAACSARSEDNHAAIDAFSAGVGLWGVDAQVAAVFGRVKAELRRGGQLIEDFDLLLAATALANDLTLVSNNLAHFRRVAGLRVESWVDAD
jgi:tRNA(fMet)-specific endonuclease VapC